LVNSPKQSVRVYDLFKIPHIRTFVIEKQRLHVSAFN